MRKFFQELLDFFRKGDMVLLVLCLFTTIFGVIIVSSATAWQETPRFVIVQLVAVVLGVFLYAVISSIDLDLIMEYRLFLVIFNVLFLLLLIPFGIFPWLSILVTFVMRFAIRNTQSMRAFKDTGDIAEIADLDQRSAQTQMLFALVLCISFLVDMLLLR